MGDKRFIYDLVDRQYLQSLTSEGRNIKFFKQAKVQREVMKLLSSHQSLVIDIIDIPNTFGQIKPFMMKTPDEFVVQPTALRKQQELDYRIQRAAQQQKSQKEREVYDGVDLERREFIRIILQSIEKARFIEKISFRVSDICYSNHFEHFALDIEQTCEMLLTLKENSHFCILKNIEVESEVESNRFLINVQLEKSLKDTLLSFSNLNSVSIKKIIINDLPEFLNTLLIVNN